MMPSLKSEGTKFTGLGSKKSKLAYVNPLANGLCFSCFPHVFRTDPYSIMFISFFNFLATPFACLCSTKTHLWWLQWMHQACFCPAKTSAGEWKSDLRWRPRILSGASCVRSPEKLKHETPKSPKTTKPLKKHHQLRTNHWGHETLQIDWGLPERGDPWKTKAPPDGDTASHNDAPSAELARTRGHFLGQNSKGQKLSSGFSMFFFPSFCRSSDLASGQISHDLGIFSDSSTYTSK